MLLEAITKLFCEWTTENIMFLEFVLFFYWYFIFPHRLLFIIYGEKKIFNVPVQDRIPSTYWLMLLLPAKGNLVVRP
jgi:hypothetical protein